MKEPGAYLFIKPHMPCIRKNLSYFGLALFLILISLAVAMYPGGSKAFPKDQGYKLSVNYICDLSRGYAFNGLVNTARIAFMIAMGCLCGSIAIIVWDFAKRLSTSGAFEYMLRFCGVGSMLSGMLLFSSIHNLVVLPAFILSFAGLVMIIIRLYKIKAMQAIIFGYIILVLLLVNYAIFISGFLIRILPAVQKLTLFIFILWLVKINELTKNRIREETKE